MTDDAHAPTIGETIAATQPAAEASASGVPALPDGRYSLRAMIGRGGMGEVWLAHDARVDREIAIKLMRGEASQDPDAVARFLREARVQGRLEHPAIVPVHDLGGEASPYFAMKRLAGRTLSEVLAGKRGGDRQLADRWTRQVLLARLIDVCNAIDLAHDRGVIHRDLKPANIMLGDFGETYVLDWGLARIVESAPRERISSIDVATVSPARKTGETAVGTLLGTPGYMPPEQLRGDAVDARADIFALGCILFEILADGTPAVAREHALDPARIIGGYRPRERRPELDIPPELDELCARATAADAGARLATARELADGLQRFLDGDRDTARRRALAAEHASRAAAAFARATSSTTSDDARTDAMREGGRALALDPTNVDAQKLVAQLLLTPPKEIPAAVRDSVQQSRMQATRAAFRAAAFAYVAFILVYSAIAVAYGRRAWPLVTGEVLLVIQTAIFFAAARAQRDLGRAFYPVVFVTHGLLLAVIGIIASPLFVLPIMVMSTLAMALSIPTLDAPKLVVATLLTVVGSLLVLEWLNVLPRTFHPTTYGILFESWAIQVPAAVLIAAVLLTLVIAMLSVTAVLTAQRRAAEAAQETVHLHLWHMSQLVPEATAGK